LDHSKLPLIPGTLDYSREGFCAGGLTSNQQFFGKHVSIKESIVPEVRNVLFDPQTSGGLLIFSHPQDATGLLLKLHAENIAATEIGFTANLTDHLLTVT
jgi:selenide,water dikinase